MGGLPVVEPRQTAAQAGASPTAYIRPPAPEGFEEFFRTSFRKLVGTAMSAGAKPEEAQDAAAKALAEMLPAWPVAGNPLAYARRAVISNFIKDKTRGNRRVVQRLIERGHVPRQEGVFDGRLTEWEDDQWVVAVLSVLPPTQRQVMGYIARGFSRQEIAEELGKSQEAVRRNLCDACHRLAELLHPDGEPRHLGPATAFSSTTARFFREEAR
jgi:RNA polymerase sigma factor (sigma-70 family)